MPGLLNNAVHIRPNLALGSLLAALLAAAPQLSGATLKAKISSDAHLAAGEGHEVFARSADTVQVGDATVAENVEFLTKTLARFQSFASSAQLSIQMRHRKEEQRLKDSISQASDANVKKALEQSVASNNQALEETQGIYSNIVSFSNDMLSMLKKTSKSGLTCDQLSCGKHASCADTFQGASCVCDEGYVGLGQECHAPTEFQPHLLLGENAAQAADIHVAAFDDNKVAVVFRDMSKDNAGAVVVGTVSEAGSLELSPVELFTAPGAQAFSPVVTGTDGRRIAIAWRDGQRSGTCRLRAAALGSSGIRGAEMALVWGTTVDFCSNQAHKMSVQSFAPNRIMVLYSDKATGSETAESFGNSVLADIGSIGEISLLGNFRFTDSAVARLEAAKVSKNGFVLAARASPAVDDMNPTPVKQEAMAMYGELVGDDLVFDPNPVNLEPGQVWARGLSLIAPNTLAYAYQDASKMELKMAVLDIDPQTHRMKVVEDPSTFQKGFSPYVSMLSMPYSESDPYTLTYYQGEKNAIASICAWNSGRQHIEKCEDFPWLSQKVSSVSGTPVGEGRVMMTFVESDVPYYMVFGLSKK
ncbi:unnamed protein product [Durusdinium trenchii]|uniref:EGF-like domain-containing protein n=1 Tax=Durusdinium trenchii TaxID=1381693 RepID=A0ABP0QL32_9DINO